MAYENTIRRIRLELDDTFDQLNTFFDLPANLRQFQPAENEWSIDEILEHITLTSHFLLITLKQSLIKVLRRAKEQPIPSGESRLNHIVRISDPDAFDWVRPEHMEPTRQISSADVRLRMTEQHNTCAAILQQIENGEGALHCVNMSVQELGKLDMYEWLYFLIQHAQRHVVEMNRICEIYNRETS